MKMSNQQFIFTRRSNVSHPSSAEAIWDPEYPFTNDVKVDWKETPTIHEFKVDVPGLNKEEVKVDTEGGQVLLISGERRPEQKEKDATWQINERSSGKFLRRFRLPENAKMDEVKANLEKGVLTVTVNKEEVKNPEVKSIPVSENPKRKLKRQWGEV